MIGGIIMQHAQEDSMEQRSLRSAAITYYLVMLAGLAIGLYGLVSLFWLTMDQVQQRQLTGSVLGL
jgi:hypothetical protein